MGDGGKTDWLPRSQRVSSARASQTSQRARRAARGGMAGRGLWERREAERQRDAAEGAPGMGGERVALQFQRVVEEEQFIALQSHRQDRRGGVEKTLQGTCQLELVVLEDQRGRGGREVVREDVAVVDEAENVRATEQDRSAGGRGELRGLGVEESLGDGGGVERKA